MIFSCAQHPLFKAEQDESCENGHQGWQDVISQKLQISFRDVVAVARIF